MDDRTGHLRWGAEQRLEFIEFRLFWDGGVNRADITEKFGVSVPQASNDISLYKEKAGANITYDSSEKRYIATSDFKPVFLKPNAERYLAQLKAIAERVIDQSDTMIAQLPSTGVMPIPARRVQPDILRALLRAVREKASIQIYYQSMNDARPEPTWRVITPHAFSSDSLRWHIRAYCHESEEFKDFIISRCLDVGELGRPGQGAEHDDLWNTTFDITLIPNPKLSPAQRKTIELDYGMEEGRAIVTLRHALMYYFHKRLRLDVAAKSDRPKETPVVVENRAEYDDLLRKLAY